MIIVIIKDNHIFHNNLQYKTKIYRQRIKQIYKNTNHLDQKLSRYNSQKWKI